MKALFLIPLLCAGCAIEKINRPPYGSAITTHVRFFGVKANVPVGGGEVMGVSLGWGSSTWTVIPVSTNEIFMPKYSDTFSVGQTINPFDTRIREYLQTGWEGDTPTPANLFAPK
jgi:hypothetical protein